MLIEKCIIVEGRADKLQLEGVLAEQVLILCTNGTKGEVGLLDMLEPYEDMPFYTMFDRDKSGEQLRRIMKRIYSDAIQFTVPKPFIQVEETPRPILAELLKKQGFSVRI